MVTLKGYDHSLEVRLSQLSDLSYSVTVPAYYTYYLTRHKTVVQA